MKNSNRALLARLARLEEAITGTIHKLETEAHASDGPDHDSECDACKALADLYAALAVGAEGRESK